MSCSLTLRSRAIELLWKQNRRFLCSNSHKEPLIAADQAPSPAAPSEASGTKSRNFLLYTFAGLLTGATAGIGYASYAYSWEEVEKKTRDIRAEPARYKVPDDAPTLDKVKSLLFSSAMTVPAKAIEIYLDARKIVEEYVRDYTDPCADKLLPDSHPLERHAFTLVLDLQETLLYSYWTREKGWQTIKRPGVDAFLEHLAQYYEIVVYSDYSHMYVDPVMERLDPKNCVRYKLGKAATRYMNGQHYRDLAQLNRDPGKIIYLSAHARENSLQPENGAVIKPFKLELGDTALLDFIPFLEFVARNPPADIRQVLASFEGRDIPEEFIRRSKELRKKMQEQKQQGRLWKF